MVAVAVFEIQMDKKPVAAIIPSKSLKFIYFNTWWMSNLRKKVDFYHFGSEPTTMQTRKAIFRCKPLASIPMPITTPFQILVKLND
jgi:hypothetical protein